MVPAAPPAKRTRESQERNRETSEVQVLLSWLVAVEGMRKQRLKAKRSRRARSMATINRN